MARRLELQQAQAVEDLSKKPAQDEDEKALKAFMQYRASYKIDYARVNDEDVLIDAMNEAETLELKKLLMRYRRLKNEANSRD